MATNLAQDGSAICAELNPGNVNNKRFPPLSVIWRWLRELTTIPGWNAEAPK
jgi:hypothetical protein